MIHYQELEGDNLSNAMQKAEGRTYQMDYQYNLHKVLFELIKKEIIDIRWIYFEENFKQYATNGNWLAGMYDNTTTVPKWKTAYGKTPEEAIMRVFVRVKLGEMVEIPDA